LICIVTPITAETSWKTIQYIQSPEPSTTLSWPSDCAYSGQCQFSVVAFNSKSISYPSPPTDTVSKYFYIKIHCITICLIEVIDTNVGQIYSSRTVARSYIPHLLKKKTYFFFLLSVCFLHCHLSKIGSNFQSEWGCCRCLNLYKQVFLEDM
jgi:hypothetical protein